MPPSTKTFVLIHGAWHGAWCWQRVIPLLESAGHRVVAPDLPSMGADRTDPARVTLESWAQFVVDLLERESAPVLVGHSRAGVVISRAAELAPERVGSLVYLAAYLLTNGRSVADEARGDEDSLIAANMIPVASGVTCALRDDVVRDAFYARCSPEDVAFARARLSAEPVRPLATPLRVTNERFGAVPRSYIGTVADRTVSPVAQRRMQAALPCRRSFTLDSDHSPFLSCPARLAQVLGGL